MEFAAFDVETANADLASICQIGIVAFSAGSVVGRWQSLVNPEDYFDATNTLIHGITEDAVRGGPVYPALSEEVRRMLGQKVVVTHTVFDQIALSRVAEKYQLAGVECRWLDTVRVARRAWPQFRTSGYGLANLAKVFGIGFRHHEAQEDARVAGELLLRAVADTGIPLDDWLTRAYQPIPGTGSRIASRQGDSQGPLSGETVVFTGALSMPRQQAAESAAKAGCNVGVSVSRSTTILVVGDQDIRRLAGRDKSSKQRKAEELIGRGQTIRILGESDFVRLVNG